jgi:hypothetical protein
MYTSRLDGGYARIELFDQVLAAIHLGDRVRAWRND